MKEELRKGLLQNLQIDRFFGLRTVPGRAVGPTGSRSSASAGLGNPPEAVATAKTTGKIGPAQATQGNPEEAVQRKRKKLEDLERQAQPCSKCPLHADRTHMVFGEGHPDARIVFVGEAPGFEEDRQGRPFVGRAGQLLTDIITKGMGLNRSDVYICNVLKCRPPENRTPSAEEIVACSPLLFEQLKIIQPEVIIALGAPAAKTLLETKQSITRLRGQFFDYCVDGPFGGQHYAKLMPTFHPAYLLRNPAGKVKVWEDIKQVLNYLGLPIPTRRKR